MKSKLVRHLQAKNVQNKQDMNKLSVMIFKIVIKIAHNFIGLKAIVFFLLALGEVALIIKKVKKN